VIDRAGEWDGDAVRAARNRPSGGEGGDTFPADSPAADDAPADGARTDAVLTAPEQRSAAHRLYRDRVDHTYDVARIEAGADAGPQDSQRPQDPQNPRPQDASEDGATRDASEDGATRDAWAEALPGLRAEWEKHEREFPERSPSAASSQADGGWFGEGDRRLNPEQNTDASKACEDIRTEGREVIRPAMERVEAADPGRRLAGLEHMLKGEDRLKEKIADVLFVEPNLTAKQAADKVTDAVRFTFTYTRQRYAEGVLFDVERLKSEGFELIKLKNLWEKEQYKGINSQWRRPETGLRFEVQFHTSESLEAKELTHQAYERLRSTQVNQVERDGLEDYQKRVNTQIVTPPGTTEIEEFPRKHG
jgi:hypothetical protein